MNLEEREFGGISGWRVLRNRADVATYLDGDGNGTEDFTCS
jgi:hypothetical protein